jgi:hypothetical protein
VPGATGPTFTLPNVQGSQNNTHISVCVSNIGGGTCSGDAVLTVIANPVLVAASTRGNCHALYLTFSKNVALGTTPPPSFTLDNGVSVISSNFGVNNRELVLHLSPDVVPDITYTLTVQDLKSFDNFTILPNPTTKTFVHGAEFPLAQPTQGEVSKLAASQFVGGIDYKRWNGFNSFGNNASGRPNFLDQPVYTTQPPDISSNGMERFEGPWTNDGANYGDEWSGMWTVPKTGVYRFWCASDDQSATFIATDGIPANMVQMCSEPQWVAFREFLLPTSNGTAGRGNPPINVSAPFNLTAGQQVYLQADHLEGGGGDNYSLTYAFGRVSAGGVPFTTLCDVFCNPGPSDVNTFFGRPATFTVVPDGTPPYSIQWKSNGVAIAGATSATYTTPPVNYPNDGDVYSVDISNFFSSTSCSATVHVGHNPIVVSAETRGSPNVIYVTYNKAVQLTGTGNYSFPLESGTLFVDSVDYATPGDHTVVAVVNDGLDPGTTHLFRISGVIDEEASNPVVPDPTDITIVQSVPTRLFADFSTGVPAWTTVGGNVAPTVGADKSLHLTENGATGQQNSWTIPLGGVQTVTTLNASWTTLMTGPIGNAADGFSFSAGQDLTFPVSAEEGSAQGLSVTVDTYNNGANETGLEIRWNGARLAFTPVGGGATPGSVNGPAELERNIFVPANLSVTAAGHVVFDYDTYEVVADIPGYVGIQVNQYVFYARTGGAAESCYIDNVNINDEGAVLGPPVITVTPTGSPVSAIECSTVTLVSSGGGSPPLTYQWWKNGVLLPGAVCPTYVTPSLRRGPDDTYTLVVSNRLATTSVATTIHVVPDSTPPTIVSVGSLNGSAIGVRWSKPIDLVTGTDTSKYNIDGRGAGTSIGSIIVSAGGTTAVINVTPPVGCTFSVSESGVLDACPGLDSTTSSAIGHVASMSTQDIGISGDPSPEGTTIVFGDGSFEMTAGGSDIWGTDDHGRFTYTTLVDSFDVRVKVARLDFQNTWSKGGLMARQTLDDNSPTINTYFTPTLGANGIEAGARTTVSGNTDAWGAGCGGAGCDLTDTPWIRLQRIHSPAGDEFIGYHAPDVGGSPGAWVNHADTGVLPPGSIPDTLFVGLMLTSHNNGVATTGDLVGLAISPTGPLSITLNGLGQPVVSWTDCTSRLQGTTTLIGNAGANSIWTDIAGTSPKTVTNPSYKYFRTVNP